MLRRLERYFEFDRLGTNWRTEILAGATTFVTMAYIVFVNPSILQRSGYAVSSRGGGDVLLCGIRQHPDGRAGALSHRAGAGHGTERVFHLHGGQRHGRSVGNGARRGVSVGRRVSDSDGGRRAPADRRGDSWRAVCRGRRRHRTVHRDDRPAQRGDCRSQPRDSSHARQSAR